MQHNPVGATNAPLSPNPFFATAQQRVALARQRFFEEGVRPTGLISESVIQSWSRCLQAHVEPERVPVFNPVTPSRVHSVLANNRVLLQAAATELEQLRCALAGTSAAAILTDARGVVMSTSWQGRRSDEVLMPLAARVGVNLAEDLIGTNAPALTAHSGQPSVVMGQEHFCTAVQVMQCAAAPIRDLDGRLAAVLDLSSEGRPLGFDAASVVGLYATAIENRLFCALAREQLLVQMQLSPALLGTPIEGLAGIAGDGRIAWLNPSASRLLGVGAPWPLPAELTVESAFGQTLPALLAGCRDSQPRAVRLPNGLAVWLRTRLQVDDGAVRLVAPGRPEGLAATEADDAAARPTSRSAGTEPAGQSLLERERQMVQRAVQECGGNVSQAARRLGVSRGLVYRRLRERDRG